MTRIYSYQSGMSNAFFIIGEESTIAVDTGSEIGEKIVLEQCELAGIMPEDIKLIVITHGHADHFMNLPEMTKLTKAPVLCHEQSAHFLIKGELPDVDLAPRNERGKVILQKQSENGAPCDIPPSGNYPDIMIRDEFDLHTYGILGKIIYTPGHSRGDISVILESGEAFVGDLFAAEAFQEISDMPYFSYPGARFEEAQESVQKLLESGTRVIYSGHGNPSDAAYMTKCLKKERQQYNC